MLGSYPHNEDRALLAMEDASSFSLPLIRLPEGQSASLTWYAANHSSQPCDYIVTVQANGQMEYFQYYDLYDEDSEWSKKTVDLSNYAGQTIGITFLYFNGGGLLIDDINVEAGSIVNLSCAGDGFGLVLRGGEANGNLCGRTDAVPVGMLASYEFLPIDGTLTHLYVNNVDHINDVVTYTSGVSVYNFTPNARRMDIVAVFAHSEGNVVLFNCTGNGTGYVHRPSHYGEDLCGGSDFLPQGMVASYEMLITEGRLKHLYVNNVDYINDAVINSFGTGCTYSFTPQEALTVVNPVFGFVELTVIPSDSTMGTVSGGGYYHINDVATLNAIPKSGFSFVRWQDGDITNPRQYTVHDDTTIVAIFAPNNAIDEVEVDDTKVYCENGRIYVDGVKGRSVRVFDVAGRQLSHLDRAGNLASFSVSGMGVYIITVGDRKAYRVVVK